ncbi:MAG TPA: sigma-54-dependent Fis family transcriptional regulator [Planctomycetaceae bacterium]|nr:sigma-54-dependent Fis family transcriptional regulator [Planctomycetaceae bacterium]
MTLTEQINVLVVDDEPAICWGFEKLLRGEGHAVLTAGSAEAGLKLAAANRISLIILDVRLPGESGLDALPKFIAASGGAPVIVITAFGDLETAVTAVRQGAVDYLTKPFRLEDAAEVCRQALRRSVARIDNRGDANLDCDPKASQPWVPGLASKGLREPGHADALVGTSAAMQKVFRQIALVAASDLSVLITGETGTGKELVAAAIHRHSHRKDRPYLAIAPVALSPSLLESELFGHVRGAFTGANEDRKGFFETAAGGTILLDEIGDLPLAAQVKLLRVLEQRQFTPVGSVAPRDCDVRILAATHRDLRNAVAAATFREDLLYRLTAVTIELPPLRTRTEDIAVLAKHFLRRMGYPDPEIAIDDSLVRHLSKRRWLGNIRELRNAVEHAAVIARGRPLDIADFPEPQTAGVAINEASLESEIERWTWQAIESEPAVVDGGDADSETPGQLYERFLAATEPALIRTVLNATGGNRAAAAQRLGMHRATLRERMKRYGFD